MGNAYQWRAEVMTAVGVTGDVVADELTVEAWRNPGMSSCAAESRDDGPEMLNEPMGLLNRDDGHQALPQMGWWYAGRYDWYSG